MRHISRRGFLKVAGISAAALTAGCTASGVATPPPTAVGPGGAPTVAPAKPAALPSPPGEIQITPVADLYRQSYGDSAEVDGASWRLAIDGLVEKPLTLSLDDIQAMPAVEETRTLECIGNPVGGPLIGTVVWKGIYLSSLLDQVKVASSATRAKFEAADGYSTSHTLDWVLQPHTMLIYEMNGEPLTRDHGYPLRILMPGLYGQKNPKWITHIEFIDYDYLGYWEKQGWSDVAEVQTNSIIRQPDSGATLPAGTVPIFGVAFAGKRKITLVEVKIDDGEWLPAKLVQADSSLIWTQWSLDWLASEGKHILLVRATDEAGFTQSETGTALLGDAYPNGTAKIHSVVVKVKAG